MAKKFAIPFAATGDKAVVPDALQPDGSVSYTQGFGPDYELDRDLDPINAKDVPRDETNQLFFDVTDAIGEIQKNGASIWSLDMAPYPINARVYYADKLWRSNVINNNGEPGVSANWDDVSSIPISGQNIAVFTTAGVTNWSVPAVLQSGRVKARVTVIGGGGGGGRIDASCGGGGASGGASKRIIDLTGVAGVSITIGSGGLGSTVTGTAGLTGGTTSFGAFVSATGGDGGSSISASGGSPGSGAGGDVNIIGNPGGNGVPGLATRFSPGVGGASILGGAGRTISASANTAGGIGTLGGGGGGSVLAANGGNGGNGVCIIEW